MFKNSIRRLATASAALGLLLGAGLLNPSSAPSLIPAAYASEAGFPLDRFPTSKMSDEAALQDGAATFVNYCLNCHEARSMRFNRLRDIGLNETQIKNNLLFGGEKVGDTMKIAMRSADAKTWFGAQPPDLSVIARARASNVGSGADWLYTYMRSFYRDAQRPTGWNNALFPNVGMPHVMWQLQGPRGARIEDVHAVGEGDHHSFVKTVTTIDPKTGLHSEKKEELPAGTHAHAGTTTTLFSPEVGSVPGTTNYDEKIANLVAYLSYMSDPSADSRLRWGALAMFYLLVLLGFTWWLNKQYWKDVR